MQTIVAKWPDNTISILRIPQTADVFWELDQEGDPHAAEVYRLLPGEAHMGWDWDEEKKTLTPVMYEGQRERIIFDNPASESP